MFLSVNMAPYHQLTINWSSLSPAQTNIHVFGVPSTIDLKQPLPTIISELKQLFLNHFTAITVIPSRHVHSTSGCHCYKCSVSQLLSTQCIHLMIAYTYRLPAVSFKSNGPSVHSLTFSSYNPFHTPIWTVKQWWYIREAIYRKF